MSLDPHTLEVVERWLKDSGNWRVEQGTVISGITGTERKLCAMIVSKHLEALSTRRAKQRKCEECKCFFENLDGEMCDRNGEILSVAWARGKDGDCTPSGKLWQDKYERTP